MKLKSITSCGIGAALIVGAAACVSARGLGSNLPNIGDNETAGRYIVLGRDAIVRGEWQGAEGDYHAALKACPFDEDATQGLARCAVARGDFQTAIGYYRTVVQLNPYEIALASEYTLALQGAGRVSEAISSYNHALSLCKEGRGGTSMTVYPAAFREDGGDYDPVEMAAMAHLMVALNSNSDDVRRQTLEMGKARDLAPQSSIVHYYVSALEQQAKKPGAKRAVRVAMALSKGASAKAIMKHVKQ